MHRVMVYNDKCYIFDRSNEPEFVGIGKNNTVSRKRHITFGYDIQGLFGHIMIMAQVLTTRGDVKNERQ